MLFQAVQCHQEECARMLLDARADPNTKDKNGDACLHYAVRDGLASITELLLESGKINVDIQNNVSLMLRNQVRTSFIPNKLSMLSCFIFSLLIFLSLFFFLLIVDCFLLPTLSAPSMCKLPSAAP